VEPSSTVNGVYPCLGDDEWCVISIESEADRCAAIGVLGQPQQWAQQTVTQDAGDIARRLQEAGVAAAPMSRRPDVLADPQLISRQLYQTMQHPLLDTPMPAESGPARFRNIPPVPMRPAPMPGQDTREICSAVLGFDTADIERLLADGALFTTAEGACI
jgi:CoA-transferase family III